MIVMIDINNALRELNILSLKENENNIDKLMNLMRIDQKTSKSFNLKTIFASFVLFAVFATMTFNKIIESFTKIFKIMHFNNACAITADEMQRIINIILYKQSIILLVIISIDAK